jgi:RNA polymerase sigma-70 factor (ECF subfamily)
VNEALEENTNNIDKLLKSIRQGRTYLEEAEIAKRAADRGFYEAMDTLVREYRLTVLKFCRRILFRYVQYVDEIEDVAQEVFAEVHKSLPEFRGDYGELSFRKWFYTIMRRIAYRYLQEILREGRRHNAERARLGLETRQWGSVRRERIVPLPNMSDTLEQLYGERQTIDLWKRAFAMLPPTDQVLLSMYADPQYSASDVAEQFGISVDAVRKRVERARQLLASYMRKLDRDI